LLTVVKKGSVCFGDLEAQALTTLTITGIDNFQIAKYWSCQLRSQSPLLQEF
ncbi:hypothetical protein ABKV19_012886, partial [Rosa sericea]